MFVVLFNFRKKKQKKMCSASGNWFFMPIPMLCRVRYYMTNNPLLVSISTHADYNWQTIIAVIVVIIIII